MWLQKSKGKYYWYECKKGWKKTQIGAIYLGPAGHQYLRPAKWWEVILNKLFGWQPK